MSTHTTARLSLAVSDRDHIRGPASAPVTMVEYGDFECPHCGAAYLVVEELLQNLGDDVRFVYRHFPLAQVHPNAEPAAEAAEAAGAQGKFWQMHGLLFTHQDALDTSHLIQYAKSLHLDLNAFQRALAARIFEPRVREDFLSGIRSGVNGTPTFFINDIRYDGPNFDTMFLAVSRAIEQARD
jgi:protein-disulfide isomerase